MNESLLSLLPDTDRGLFAIDEEEQKTRRAEKEAAVVARRSSRIVTRRAKCEAELERLLPERLEMGVSYHVISSADVDALSYLSHILRSHNLDYLMFSTWCMAMPDVNAIDSWIKSSRVIRADAYVGEIFPNQYTDEHEALRNAVGRCGGRVAVFKNHSKIMLGCNLGESIWFAIESSANINTNPRTENTAIHCSRELFDFYKDYFDGIRSFNRDFDSWEKWCA